MELTKIHSFYKFSLDSFIIVVNRAIDIVAERMNPKKKEAVEVAEGEPCMLEDAAEGEQCMLEDAADGDADTPEFIDTLAVYVTASAF